ncbi:MAG: hypothetical protein AAGH81_09315 [Bacteroidota bacterium]
MKSKAIRVALLLFVIQWGNAQKMKAQEMADYQTETMIEQLGLSEEQQDKIAELNLKYSKRQAALMNQEGSMFSKMGDMKQIAGDKKAELEKVLSRAQMKKFEDEVAPKMRKEMRKKMRS